MRRLAAVLAVALLAGCAQPAPQPLPGPGPGPAPGPRRDPAVFVPPETPALGELTNAAWDTNPSRAGSALSREGADQFLASADRLLTHPDGYTLSPGSLPGPLDVPLAQADWRVIRLELGDVGVEGLPLIGYWVQAPGHASPILREVGWSSPGMHSAVTVGRYLVLAAQQAGEARLRAWGQNPQGWAPVPGKDLKFPGLYWRQRDGRLQLCPQPDSAAAVCIAVGDDLRLESPDPAYADQLADPGSIRFSLRRIHGADDLSNEHARQALDGLVTHLRRPLDRQWSPAAFIEFFEDRRVRALTVAPSVRVFTVDADPLHAALLQSWTDPARPQVQRLDLAPGHRLQEAALSVTGNDWTLIYTSRGEDGWRVSAMRFRSQRRYWFPDARAFSAALPGGLVRFPGGVAFSGPGERSVEIGYGGSSITLCEPCITLVNQNGTYIIRR